MTTTTPVMQKNVTVKVYNTVTKTYEVVELTKDGQITTIKATKNVNYEFFDHSIGRAPNHIITRRKGKDLHVSFEREGGQDDLVIEDFYEIADQSHSLIGIAEDDGYYYYIPDTGEVPDYVTQLADGDAEGHALGGERLAAPLFILPPPVGFPWWLGVGVIPFLPRKDKIWPQPEPKPEPIKGGLAKPDSASRDKVEDVTQNVTENDDGVQNNTVKLIDPVTGKMSKTVNVIGQGVWTVEADGSRVTFKPNPGFDANPTPINYVITDKAGNVLTAPVAVNYNKQLTADYKAGVSGQPVEVDVLGNDNSGVDPKTVRLIDPNNPSNPPALEVKVPNEGTWTVDPTTGKVTFTPNPDFKGDPTVIHYVAKDTNGNDVPSKAPITVDYPTVANPDSKVGKPGEVVTQNVTGNDNPDVDPATIKLIDPKNPTNPPSDKVTVPNEGTWTVDDKGNVTFTPDPSFKGNPTPIQYVGKDKDGSDVPPAAVSVIYYSLSASAPFARSNSKSGTEAREPVTQKVAGNDTGIDPSTIKLIDPTTKTPTDTVTVAGEGVWTLKAGTDEVTFTSDPSFKGNPTPITYTGSDVNGTPIAKPAEVRVSYPKAGPAASDDVEVGETGQPTTVNVAGNDSDTLDPTTIKLIDPTTNQPSTTVTVPNEGTWTVDDKGNVTFTPDPSFKGDPTPIQYTASDKNGTPVENPANIVIDYPTVANPDSKVGKPGEVVTQNVTGNDNPDVDPATIKLIDPKNPTNPPSDKVTVPNEGTWTVDDKGNVTFTPEGGFKGDPTPIQYVGKDKDGHDVPPTTVDVAVVDTPVVTMPDSKPGKRGDSVTQDVTKNDTDIDRATIKLIDPNNPSNPPSTSVTVPGQGTWTVDDKGNVTFSPETGFDGDPDPINYVGNKIGSNEVSRPTPVHVSYPEDVPVVPNTPMVGIKATDDKSVEGLDPTLVFDVTATRDPKDTPKTETVTVKPTADSKVTPEDIASITYTDATGKETTINTPEAIKDFFDNGVVVGVPANKDSSPITITTKDDDLYEKSEPISLELSKPATGTTIDPTATKADGKIDDEPAPQDPNKPPFDPNNPTNPNNNPPVDNTEGDKPNTPMVGIKATDDKSVEGLDPTLVFDVTATRDPKDTPKTETVTVKPTADSKVTPEDIASITYTDATGKETTINTPEAIKDFFDNGVVVGVPANKDSSPITITTKDDDLYEKSEPISLELSKPATGTTIDPTATKADGKIDDEPAPQDPNKPPFDPNNPTNPNNNPPVDNTEGDKPNTPMVGIKATDDKSVEGLDPTLVFDVTATRDPKDTPKTETVTVKPTADSKVTPEDIASITYTDATGKETTINTPEAIKDFFDNGVVVGVPANKDSSPITITTKDDDLYEKSEPISLELSKPATGTTIDPTATKADGKIDDEPAPQDPNKPPFDPNNPTNPNNNPPVDNTEGDKPNTPMVGIKATDDKSVEGLDPTLVFDVTATRDPKDTPKTETVTVKPTADSKVTPEDIASITYTDATGKETTINTPEAIKDFFDNGVVVGVPANKDSSPITITTKDDDLYEKSEPISLELSKPATGTTIDPTATKADGKIDDEPAPQDPNKPPFDPNNPTNPNNNPPVDNTEGDKPNTPMVGIKATDDKSVEGLDPTLVFDVTATRDPKDTPKTETVTVKPTADSKVTPEDIASITYTDATGKETTINTPEAIKDFFDNGVVVGVPANKDSSPITITTKDDDLYEKSEPISLELSKPATGTTIDPTATKADGKIDDEPAPQDPNKPPFDPNNPTNPNNNPPVDNTEGDKPNTPMVGIKATDDKSVEGLDPTLVFDVTATRDPKDTPKTETVTVKPTADSKVTPEDIASITYTDATGKETTINTPEAIKDFFDNGVVVGVPANKDSSPITITTKDDDLYEKSEPISLELSKPATGTTIDPTATKADGKIDDEPAPQDPNKPPFDPNNPTNPNNNPPVDNTEGDKPNTPMVGIKATDDKSVEGLDPTLVFDVTATRDPKDTPKTETVTVKPTADSKVTPEDIASITYTDATGKETTINTPEAIKDFFDNGVVVGVPANKDSSPITITTKDDDLYEKSEPISLELSKPATGTTIDPTATKADGKIDDEPAPQDPNKPPFDPNNPTNPNNNPPVDNTEGDKPNTPMVGIKATDDKSVEGLDPTLVFDVTATRDPKDTPKTETVTVKPTADSKVTPEDIASITYTDATGKETTINTPEAIKDFFDNGVVVGVPANKDSSPITITTKDDDLYEKSEPISLELSKPATGTTIDPTATKADGKIDDEPAPQDPNKPPFDPNNPTNPNNNPPVDNTEGDKPNTPMVGIKATDDKSVEGLDPTLVFDVTATRDPKDTPKTETVTVKPTADSKVTPEDIASITYTDATGKETTINTPEAIKDFFDNGVVVGVPANKDSSPITITTKDDDLYEKSEPISLELSKPATGTTIDPTATKADGKIDDEPAPQDPNKPPFDPNNPTNPNNNPPVDNTEGDKPNTPMVGIKATDDKSVEGLDPTLVFDVTATRDPKDTPKTETVTVKPTADSKVTPEDIASITYTDATGKETTINTPEAIKDFFDNGVVVGVPANKDSSPITITTKDDDLYEKSEPISLELSKPATGTTIDPTATKADGKIDDEPAPQDPNKPPFDPNNPTNPNNNPPVDNTEGDKPNTPMVGIKATDDKSVEGLDPTLVFDVTATRDPKDTPKTETVTVKPTADSKVTPEDIASITYTDATGKETTINTPEAIKDFFDNGVVVGVPANKDSSPITITTKDDDLYEKSEPISLELSKPATGTTIDPTATKADGKIDDEPAPQDPNKPPFDPNNPTNPNNNPPVDNTEGDKPNTPMVGIKATDDKSVEGLDPTLVFDVTATRDPKDTPKTETVTVKPTADSKVTPEDIASITYTDATGKETTINTPEAIKDFFDNGVVVGVPANKDSSPITITTKDDDLYEKSEPISLELSKPATGTTIDPTATKADGKIDDEPAPQDPNKPPFDPNNPTNPNNNPPVDNTEGDKPNTPMVGIKATDDKSVEGLDPTLVFDVTATRDPKDTPKTETVTVKPTADSKVTPEDIASITYTDATGKETTINTPEAIKDFFDNGVVVGVPANKDSSPITITTKDDDLYEKSEPISLELSKPATGTTIDPTATKADGKIDDEPAPQDPNKPPFDPNNPTNPNNNPPVDNTEGDKPTVNLTGPDNVLESAGKATYTFTLADGKTSTEDIVIKYKVKVPQASDTINPAEAADFGANTLEVEKEVVLKAGQPSVTVDVPIAHDTVYEGKETYEVVMTAVTGANKGTDKVTTTINDFDGEADGNKDKPTIELTPPTHVSEEGLPGGRPDKVSLNKQDAHNIDETNAVSGTHDDWDVTDKTTTTGYIKINNVDVSDTRLVNNLSVVLDKDNATKLTANKEPLTWKEETVGSQQVYTATNPKGEAVLEVKVDKVGKEGEGADAGKLVFAYTSTLLKPIDHPDTNGEDNLPVNFNVKLQDNKADVISENKAVVIVEDDMPEKDSVVHNIQVGHDHVVLTGLAGGFTNTVFTKPAVLTATSDGKPFTDRNDPGNTELVTRGTGFLVGDGVETLDKPILWLNGGGRTEDGGYVVIKTPISNGHNGSGKRNSKEINDGDDMTDALYWGRPGSEDRNVTHSGKPYPESTYPTNGTDANGSAAVMQPGYILKDNDEFKGTKEQTLKQLTEGFTLGEFIHDNYPSSGDVGTLVTTDLTSRFKVLVNDVDGKAPDIKFPMLHLETSNAMDNKHMYSDDVIILKQPKETIKIGSTTYRLKIEGVESKSSTNKDLDLIKAARTLYETLDYTARAELKTETEGLLTEEKAKPQAEQDQAKIKAYEDTLADIAAESKRSPFSHQITSAENRNLLLGKGEASNAYKADWNGKTNITLYEALKDWAAPMRSAEEALENSERHKNSMGSNTDITDAEVNDYMRALDQNNPEQKALYDSMAPLTYTERKVMMRIALEDDVNKAYLNAAGKLDELKALLEAFDISLFSSPETFSNKFDIKAKLEPVSKGLDLTTSVDIQNKIHTGGDAKNVEVTWDGAGVTTDPSSGTATLTNKYGTFIGNKDGSYKFVAVENIAEMVAEGAKAETENFELSYTYKDNDGDVVTSNIKFNFTGLTKDEMKTARNHTGEGDSNDYFVGSTKADIIDGKAGDDTIVGNGGGDTLIGGLGNDVIFYDEGASIYGDEQDVSVVYKDDVDTLSLVNFTELNNAPIDFTNIANVKGVEVIDMTNDLAQTLNITLSSVLDMTDDRNTLFIKGDETGDNKDTVNAQGQGFVKGDTLQQDGITYELYTSGEAKLYIEQGINVIL